MTSRHTKRLADVAPELAPQMLPPLLRTQRAVPRRPRMTCPLCPERQLPRESQPPEALPRAEESA